VDETIGLGVMSSKPGRVPLGTSRPARRLALPGGLEPVVEVLPDDEDEPFDLVAARERIATAADLITQLDPGFTLCGRSGCREDRLELVGGEVLGR
jgi:hypothetical protein